MMTRKRLSSGILAIGLCLALGLGGCQAKEEAAVAEADGAGQAKVLNIASGGELDNLSTIIMDPNNTCAQKLVYETLMIYDNGTFKPCLAESWDWNADKTALTFHLRQGVTFHDGEPFNAEAVKACLSYYASVPNNGFLKGVSTISAIDVADEYTVTLHYPQPYFAVLNDLCSADVGGMISPKSFEPDNFVSLKSFAGTGPYTYEELVKGEYTRFVRNEDYWGGAPYYDEVIAKYIPDSASRLKALQTGEVDLIFGSAMLTYDDYQQALSLPNIAGQVAEQNERTRNIVVNASGEMCADVRVRRAIAQAIDKETIASGLTYGYEEAAGRLFSENVPHTDCTLKQIWSYDPEAAKTLLDEAGWVVNAFTGIREKDGVPLRLVFTYQEEVAINSDIATAVKSQLAAVGVDVSLNGMEQMLWWQSDMHGEFDLTIWNTNAAATVPHTYFSPWLDSSAGYAATLGLREKSEIDAAIHSYMTTADEQAVDEIFSYLLNFSNDQVIDIPLTYTKETIVYNSQKIAGYRFFGYSEFFDITALEPAE